MRVRQNHIALIFLLAALVLDFGYYIYTRQLNQQFHMDTLALVVRLRPVLLITFYGLLCLAASRASGVLSGYVLIGGVALLLFLAFPVFNIFMLVGLRAPEAVRVVVNAASASQLALALNTGSLILGFGLYQRFARR